MQQNPGLSNCVGKQYYAAFDIDLGIPRLRQR